MAVAVSGPGRAFVVHGIEWGDVGLDRREDRVQHCGREGR